MIYNDAYVHIMRARHPAALGASARVVWQEIWETIGPQYEAVLAEGKPLLAENVLLPLEVDGRMQDFYWIYMLAPVYEQGKILGIYNTGQNTTESTIATHRYRQGETRSARILNSICDAVIVTGQESRIAVMNPVAEVLTGWTLEEACERPLSEIFQIVEESTSAPLESPVEQVKRTGAIVGMTTPTLLIARDERPTRIDSSGAPIRNDAGELAGAVLVFRDINERRAIEREREADVDARRRNEARLKLATEAAELGIFLWTPDGDHTSWENERIYEIFGRTQEDGPINAEEFATRIVHPDFLPEYIQANEAALATGVRFFFQGSLPQER